MPLWREGTLPVGFERIKRNNNDNVPRKRDKERERDKNVFIHYHSHTQIRYEKEASGYLENYTLPPPLSLSLLSSEPVDSQTHPALFYNRPYIPFVAWKRTREQSSIHSSHLLFTYSPSARYYTPPPPPISLTPISSPSPIPFSQFAPCPRDISPRIQLG